MSHPYNLPDRVWDIAQGVLASYPDVTLDEVMSTCRKGAVAWARQEMMYLIRGLTKPDGKVVFSYQRIGRLFKAASMNGKGMDHATVRHAYYTVQAKQRREQIECVEGIIDRRETRAA